MPSGLEIHGNRAEVVNCPLHSGLCQRIEGHGGGGRPGDGKVLCKAGVPVDVQLFFFFLNKLGTMNIKRDGSNFPEI